MSVWSCLGVFPQILVYFLVAMDLHMQLCYPITTKNFSRKEELAEERSGRKGKRGIIIIMEVKWISPNHISQHPWKGNSWETLITHRGKDPASPRVRWYRFALKYRELSHNLSLKK